MPKLLPYARQLDYSYALGVFPAMKCLENRPELCLRLLLHSQGEESEGVQKLKAAAESRGIRAETADRAIERVARKENVFAAMVFRKAASPLSPERPHILLHQVADSGNLGTILRTCLGFGFEDIALFPPCADVYEPHTVRASMGALFSLRVSLFDSFEAYRDRFPGHALFPFMLDGAKPLSEIRAPASPYALVFGNEARGLPASFASLGQAVRIEHSGAIDSLNVAVAVALGAYAFSHAPKEELHHG